MDLKWEENELKKIKTPLIFSLIALVLSFFLGLINGVSFLSIIIRSLTLAIITGAFVFGARILLERFVPELFSNSGEVSGSDEAQKGQNVNISIDEPIDLNEDAKEPETKRDLAPGTGIAQEETKAGTTDFVADDLEELEELEELDSADEEKSEQGSVSSGVEDNKNTTNNKAKAQGIVEELNELPDMQEFIPADKIMSGSEETDFTQIGTGKFDASAKLSDPEIDTNLMAEAIKTVLRRDS